MKKTIKNILLVCLLVIIPIAVSAEVKLKPVISNKPIKTEAGTNNTEIRTYAVEIEPSDSTQKITEAKFTFDYSSAVRTLDCEDNPDNGFIASTVIDGDGKKCTFAIPESKEGIAGQKIRVGYVKVTVDKTAKDEDCVINYSLDGVEGKINPETGMNIPYAVIGIGAVTVAVIYFATRRKSKLYKI